MITYMQLYILGIAWFIGIHAFAGMIYGRWPNVVWTIMLSLFWPLLISCFIIARLGERIKEIKHTEAERAKDLWR